MPVLLRTRSQRYQPPKIKSIADGEADWRPKLRTEQDQAHLGPNTLLAAPPQVVNVGLELFAESLARQGARVVHVRWSPPAGGNARLASLLTKLRT